MTEPSQRGLVIAYTGDGKGKTTAAIGLAVRAAGAGLRVSILQWIKARRTGEHHALEALADRITIRRLGTGFVRGDPDANARAAALRAMDLARDQLVGGEFDMVICDEVFSAIGSGLLDEADVLGLIDARPLAVHLVMTGRGAPQAILDRADLVTEMRAVRHPYDLGEAARRGIEL